MKNIIILGRVIGTGYNMEQLTDHVIVIDGFKPAKDISLPAFPHLNIDFLSGYFETFADNGKRLTRSDIIETLASIKRAK